MGRAVLKALKESTLLTLFQICKDWGLVKDIDFRYNQIEGHITFIATGSVIYLKDLFQNPSDPEFDDLGSREYSGIFIDEGAQITTKAFNIAKSRIRYKLDEFGIIPKTLICSNPCKNFLYYDFYKPFKNKTLPKYRKFLQALVNDNPYMPKVYEENLRKLDKVSKERLLFGNWEYDDDETNLFEYDKTVSMFEKDNGHSDNPISYLTVDPARKGKDRIIIMWWVDLAVKKVWIFEKPTRQIIKGLRIFIEKLMEEKNISKRYVIIDEDGLGGGLVDELPIGVQGFINGSRPIELREKSAAYTKVPKHNFANLKSQCYFYLAKYVNDEEIEIYKGISAEIKELLIEDLEQIKQKDIDKDGKLAIIPKEEIIKNLGRSTDFSDCMMMRMFFVLKKVYKPYIAIG